MTRKAPMLTLLLLVGACSSKDLSRSKVADLLKENDVFTKEVTALPLQEDGRSQGKHDAGDVEGIWKMTRNFGDYARYTLTPQGRELFARDFGANEPAPLAHPVKRELLEVTGITSPPMAGESVKTATFTWHYAGLAPVIARYTGEDSAIHSGEVECQLFDDGWRIQELELHELQGRTAFQWPPDLQQRLQQELEAKRFTGDRALALAKTALVDYEPVLNFSFHPAWNIPERHGLTGQPLNADKIQEFLALLRRHKVEITDAGARGGYYQAAALAPPGGWSQYERKPRYTGGKSYAVFTASEVRVTAFNYSGPDSDNASLALDIQYSGCTPACELAKALEAMPSFDFGGKATDKVFYSYPQKAWPERDSGMVYFQRAKDDSWKVSGVR